MSDQDLNNYGSVRKEFTVKESDSLKGKDLSCGFGHWRPKWLQKLAKPEIFLINFSLVAIFQGATFTYLIGSLSTLEKRYSFESKISGFILIADNLSQMIISPFIGYLGNRYNRPRMMAFGEIISAFSCFMYALPYFIYGPALHHLQDSSISNSSDHEYEMCDTNQNIDDCNSTTVWSAVYILWFANFMNGIGYTAFYTVGIPYIDDNTSKKNSPLYLSASAALRLCGPSLGLLLSSISLSYYENPELNPGIAQNDPRWIGSWWLGFVVIGVSLLVFSIPMSLFPKHMSKQSANIKRTNDVSINFSTEAFSTLKRLMTNPIFVFHMCGVAVRLIGYLGYYIFKPKYIESQFRKSASDANFWTGFTSIPTMAIGIISGGIVLSKLKPKARNVALYIFSVEIIFTIIIIYAKTLRCPTPIFSQTELIDGKLKLETECNSVCHCSTKVFQPVCGDDGISNYFSPCHAGCTHQSIIQNNDNKRLFSDCDCYQLDGKLTNGYCDNKCNQFTTYITLFAMAGIISSTAKIGDTLITLRCVDPRDKSFAVGITGSFLAIFAFIPYPLIFGAITDSACMVWKESCGTTGNCWVYDIEKFTDYLHNSAFGFMLVGAIMHLVVVLYAHRIKNMFDDEDIDPTEVSLIDNESDCYENTIITSRIE